MSFAQGKKTGQQGARLTGKMREKNLITLTEAARLPYVARHGITRFRLWWWTRLTLDNKETSNPKAAILRSADIGTGKKNRWLRTKPQWVKEALVKKGVVDSISELNA